MYHNFCTLILICIVIVYYVNNRSDNAHTYQPISNQNELQSTLSVVNNNATNNATNIDKYTLEEEEVISNTANDNDNDTNTKLSYVADDRDIADNSDDTVNPLEIFTVREDDIVLGNKDSNVKVFEYFSYTCFHCAQFHTNYFQKLKEKFIDTGKVAYIKREFVTNKLDFYGTVLSRCGGPLMWEKFNDILLKQQDNWIYNNKKYIDKLTSIGEICGLSSEQFNICLEDEQLSQIIFHNNNLIRKYKHFDGTPCIVVVIDDKQVINISNLANLAVIIEKSIASRSYHSE